MTEEAGRMEEQDLVARAREGCPEARAEIAERYHGPVFRSGE